jgi:CBS domain-containing protein
MATVEQYMTLSTKTMDKNADLQDVAKAMIQHNISSIAITKDKSSVIGMLTERDIVKAMASGIPADGVTAGSLMSHPVVTITKDASIEDAARTMMRERVRHLLVQDATTGTISGIITATDLVRYLKKQVPDEVLASSEVWELFF